jgi:hypothetical protein
LRDTVTLEEIQQEFMPKTCEFADYFVNTDEPF